MRALIDTVFNPVLAWLQSIIDGITNMSVPLARPLDISQYFGYFSLLGPQWQFFITTVCALAFIYGVCYIVVIQLGLVKKFKDTIQWW